MKKLIIIILIGLTSCDECPNVSNKHRFKEGQEVKIKNKTFHNNATIISLSRNENCECMYTISYYSHLGIRRHRQVTEFEIKEK